jgi:glycosyltransferase involved in cell wall biosynthesis
MKQTFGIASEVIYPPVLVERPPRPWEVKEIGFVYLGRISYEKRIERIIDILACVRAQHPEIHLHVVGGGNGSYIRSLGPLLKRNRDWVIIEGRKNFDEKMDIIDDHRYGISARANEPFGIAVAEMAHVGNLVFVPAGGGQVEIVDHPDLVYDSPADACAKILRVLESPERQRNLRDYVLSRSGRFSPSLFMNEVRALVGRFFRDTA